MSKRSEKPLDPARPSEINTSLGENPTRISSRDRPSKRIVKFEQRKLEGKPAEMSKILKNLESARIRIEESEKKFRVLFEHIADGVLVVDSITQQFILGNQQICHMLGYSAKELPSLSIKNIHLPSDLPQISNYFSSSEAQEAASLHDISVRRKDGSVFFADINISPLTLEGRACVMGVFRDATERKLANEALKESEQRFATIFLESPIGITITQIKDYRFIDVNSAFQSITGYSRKEMIGHTPTELNLWVDPGVRDRIAGMITEQGRISSVEIRLRQKSGGIVSILLSAESVELGGENCLLGMTRDITERKIAQEQMHRFVAASPAVLYVLKVTDEGLRPAWISENICEVTGWSAIENNRWNDWWIENTHPDDCARVIASQPIPYEIDQQALEFRFRRENGTYKWIRDERRLLRDKEGKPVEIVGTWVDVSERVLLEDQFRQAQKMEAIGQLAGGVAHDFNNLLTIILGSSEIMLAEMTLEDPNRLYVTEIKTAGDRAASLTHQLLAFSRKQVLEFQVLDLCEVVSRIEKMLKRLIGEDIILTTILSTDANHVKVDPSQIEQVIINLVVNARDAMREGGRLTIEARNCELGEDYCRQHAGTKPGRYTLLSFSDTGCGMTPEIKNRIFEPFFTTKESGKGTGLGLATVFGIVKQSNGHIDVYSTVGEGSRFEIYLPAADITNDVASSNGWQEASLLGRETILVVEDDDGVRRIAVQALTTQGYKVLEANNGHTAILAAEKCNSQIHLLITDVVMPQMGGLQLAEKLFSRNPNIKIILMSGYADDRLPRKGINKFKASYLHKPFSPIYLARIVREVLDGKG